jgi:hypothetical protein
MSIVPGLRVFILFFSFVLVMKFAAPSNIPMAEVAAVVVPVVVVVVVVAAHLALFCAAISESMVEKILFLLASSPSRLDGIHVVIVLVVVVVVGVVVVSAQMEVVVEVDVDGADDVLLSETVALSATLGDDRRKALYSLV